MPLACLGVLQGYLLNGSRPSTLPKNEACMCDERLMYTHMLHTIPKLGISNLRVLAYQCTCLGICAWVWWENPCPASAPSMAGSPASSLNSVQNACPFA